MRTQDETGRGGSCLGSKVTKQGYRASTMRQVTQLQAMAKGIIGRRLEGWTIHDATVKVNDDGIWIGATMYAEAVNGNGAKHTFLYALHTKPNQLYRFAQAQMAVAR